MMMPPKLYPVSRSGTCSSVYRHGSNTQLHFEIQFTIPANGCSTNPCLNGGTCTNRACGGYSCSCHTGYGGSPCQGYEDIQTLAMKDQMVLVLYHIPVMDVTFNNSAALFYTH